MLSITEFHLVQDHIIRETTRVINSEQAEEQVDWPNERSLTDIEKLYQLPFSILLAQLEPEAKVLDVGPGKGNLISEINELFHLKCYGITTTKLDPYNLSQAKEIAYYAVPKNQDWLECHREFFDACFDTYASLTYADNAVHSLIYILLSIVPGGKFYSMSSLTPGDKEHSRFGNSKDREKIQQFFKDYFGLDLQFDFIQIESKACKPGTYMDDLRVRFQIPQEGIKLPLKYQKLGTWKLFQFLCDLVDKEIGLPIPRQNSTAFTAGKYHITMCDFFVLEESITSFDEKEVPIKRQN